MTPKQLAEAKPMGWATNPNLRHAHYMLEGRGPVTKTACGFATMPYWTCRDAEDDDERCGECFAISLKLAALKVAND
tara:strand:- start:448 stop:678 length:231 start_codon:yes stop_codon:yes gene_type:complete